MSLQKTKTANLLRICLKAGKAVKGFDSAKEALERGKAFSVLTAMDASEKTLKEVSFSVKNTAQSISAQRSSKRNWG